MSNFAISLALITLSVLDFYTIGNYRVIDALYNYGEPVEGVLMLIGVAFALGVLGLVLLLAGSNRNRK